MPRSFFRKRRKYIHVGSRQLLCVALPSHILWVACHLIPRTRIGLTKSHSGGRTYKPKLFQNPETSCKIFSQRRKVREDKLCFLAILRLYERNFLIRFFSLECYAESCAAARMVALLMAGMYSLGGSARTGEFLDNPLQIRSLLSRALAITYASAELDKCIYIVVKCGLGSRSN